MPQKLDPFELVELRLLQQGRVTGGDGRDWLRLVCGVVATIVCVLLGAYYEWSLPVVVATLVGGVILSVAWIMRAGNKCCAARLVDLESRCALTN